MIITIINTEYFKININQYRINSLKVFSPSNIKDNRSNKKQYPSGIKNININGIVEINISRFVCIKSPKISIIAEPMQLIYLVLQYIQNILFYQLCPVFQLLVV